MDIAAWLRDLGLDQYEQAFRDNAIDIEVLPDVTDADLAGLGVLLGHRRKLLRAAATLRAPATGEREASLGEAASSPLSKTTRTPEAERRQLTVLFCDLVGSTALSAQLDPEDMRDLIRAYQNAVAGEVTRFEGHVAKYMGDGVLAYFGYPQAHEDEAERAVRAGLAIAAAVGACRTPTGESLAARIGIATGLVVVGDLVGEGAAQEQAVVGRTPNLAARLQTLAEPGTVMIAEDTRRLLGGLFELRDLGARALHGFAEPVRGWRVLGESGAESRFEAQHLAGLTSLVGREEELGLLLRGWAQAEQGEGQVVLLSGEPGVGKSRLIRALRERLDDGAYIPLSHYCSLYHQTTALHPVIGLLERAAGFARGDPPGQKLAKLDALLGQGSNEVEEAAALLAALLALPTGRCDPLVAMSPQRQKERTLAALLAQLEGLAARLPVLAVYEDVHWADPTLLELLDLVVERAQSLAVLVIITFRPEFRPPWTGPEHVTALSLSRLDRRHGATMVERVSGGRALPAEVVEQIVLKTDGVPLFAEELTKAVLESGLLREEGDRYVLTGPLPPLAIPSTLHDSLLARLDRLGPVKEVAQVGAALGREFSYELLATVVSLSQGELHEALDQLCASELVFRRGTPPQASYAFKHALVRDAAYQTLLKSRRQRLHARIAEVLEECFPETVATEPELLAQHCTEAGLAEQAVEYWHRAGRHALARSALAEAVAQFNQGLEVLAGLPEGLERWRRELELQTALGGALIAARGYSAPETGRAYERARELCQQLGEVQQLFPALFGRWIVHLVRAELDVAHEAAAELLRLAQEQDDPEPLLTGHRVVGTTAFYRGEFNPGREHLQRALALHDPVRHRSLAVGYTFDPRVTSLGYLAFILLALGHPDRALARSREALAEARGLAHPVTLALALHLACLLWQFARDARAVRERAEALVALAAEQGFPFWAAYGAVLRGWALAAQEGCTGEGIEQMRRGVAAYRTTGSELWVPHFLALAADVHARAGRATEGLGLLDEALARVEATGERWVEAELHRLRGELLRSSAERDRTEACFHRALAVAREQGARMWELRAATSLARLQRDQGRRDDARTLLAPIYGWFTEGFDTADLKDAKALLEELA